MRLTNLLAILFGIGIVAWVVLSPLMYGNPKSASIRTACLSNLKQQATALQIYQSDFNDRYPQDPRWMDVLKRYVRDGSIFHHPGPDWKMAYLYAFNASLFGAKTPQRPETVPIVYDSTSLARNASDAVASLPRPGRHDGKDSIGYADGHAKAAEVR